MAFDWFRSVPAAWKNFREAAGAWLGRHGLRVVIGLALAAVLFFVYPVVYRWVGTRLSDRRVLAAQ
jgi:hypothetical protein